MKKAKLFDHYLFNNENRRIIRKRFIIHLIVSLFALAAVITYLVSIQHSMALNDAVQTSSYALTSVINTLNANTARVEALEKRYHEDNQAVLDDVSRLMQKESLTSQRAFTDIANRSTLSLISSAIGDTGSLFIVNAAGDVVLFPGIDGDTQDQIYALIDDPKQLAGLTRTGTINGEYVSGTLRYTYDTHFHRILFFDEIVQQDENGHDRTFYYSSPLRDGYFLVYGVDTAAHEAQMAMLRDLGPILSRVAVGEEGFVFAVDSQTGNFIYYNDGTSVLSGRPAADYGLTPSALTNSYRGVQTLQGTDYLCVSRTYSSSFYGDYIVISAACSNNAVFAYDQIGLSLTILTLVLCTLMCFFYAFLLSRDPNHLIENDEMVPSLQEYKSILGKRDERRSVRNVRLGRRSGMPIYLKLGVAFRLLPAIAISLILILVVSWNSQMLQDISNGISQSSNALAQLQKLYARGESSSAIIINQYQNQYLSKVRLLAHVIEIDPTALKSLNPSASDSDKVHPYLTGDLDPILNSDGYPLRSISTSSTLLTLANDNKLDYLMIFDDHGNTIATNADNWYFQLSRDPEEVSYEFLDVITGRKDYLVQDPITTDDGKILQFVGVAMKYYTLKGKGPLDGSFVSLADYESFLKEGTYSQDGYDYQVVKHRGMLEGGISDATLSSILETTTNEYLMRQVRLDRNGFIMLFDNTPEHVCRWSPHAAHIGKTAEELNYDDRMFSGNFKDFTVLDNARYFQCFSLEGDYWIATALPSDALLAKRDITAMTTVFVSFLFLLLIYLQFILSTGRRENFLVGWTKKSQPSESGDMVKVILPDGTVQYVPDAPSRFSNQSLPWHKKTMGQKLTFIIKAVSFTIILTVADVLLFSEQLFGPDSAITYLMLGHWEHGLNYFAILAFSAMVLIVAAVASILTSIITFVIRNLSSRIETVGRLLLSVVKYGSVLFSFFFGLSLLGISSVGLATSASVLSVVVGFGAQSIVADILSGVFIVFEGSFQVGDIVTVDDFRGRVLDIGLRTTKIENDAKNILITNNSKIAGIINMTKRSSTAICKFGISYNSDLEQVEKLLTDFFPKLRKRYPMILENPRYLGVDQLADSAIVLAVVAVCEEKDRLPLTRILNREMLLLMKQNGIEIPFPQMDVSIRPQESEEKQDQP